MAACIWSFSLLSPPFVLLWCPAGVVEVFIRSRDWSPCHGFLNHCLLLRGHVWPGPSFGAGRCSIDILVVPPSGQDDTELIYLLLIFCGYIMLTYPCLIFNQIRNITYLHHKWPPWLCPGRRRLRWMISTAYAISPWIKGRKYMLCLSVVFLSNKSLHVLCMRIEWGHCMVTWDSWCHR